MNFTGQQQIQLMAALDVPIGAKVEITIWDGHCYRCGLLPTGQILVDAPGSPDEDTVDFLITLWQLNAYAKQHGLDGFSMPLSLFQMKQVEPLQRSLNSAEYQDMPMNMLIPRIEKAFADFWKNFQQHLGV
jgi:hypothetical protein